MELEVPELYFERGLPGFPRSKRFALAQWGDPEGPYSLLVDLELPELRFLVVPPSVFFPEYELELDDATTAQLDLTRAEDALVLVIVSLGARPQDATANLLGPLVINLRNHRGVQTIVSDAELSVRVPLAA